MTAEIVLDSGGQNLTVYTSRVEQITNKMLAPLTFPQTGQNYAEGPKDTKILDLLRIQTRFNIDGKIIFTDKSKLTNINNAGGVFTMDYAGTSYNVNFEKFAIMDDSGKIDRKGVNDPEWLGVKFSVLVGENLQSA